MEPEANAPDSDPDWQPIDIFVFSNGQQYSPPRKYHIQAEDVTLWKSTLGFLAKMQYGPYHSTIDLFTIQGKKIVDPLQLVNGGSYVAVQPPDSFIYAGYDKYLLKASRSWEKRRAKINIEPVDSNHPQNLSNMENIDENIEYDDITAREETVILKSRVRSIANDACTLIKPQLLSQSQRRSEFCSSVAKQTERKIPLVKPPFVISKYTPKSLPPSNLKKTYSSKKDYPKPTFHISKPGERNAADKQLPRLTKTIRVPSKSRDASKHSETILPYDKKVIREKAPYPIEDTSTRNDVTFLTDVADIKNIIEDKELVMSPSLYQNPYSENSTISVKPILIQSLLYDPAQQQKTTEVGENSKQEINIESNKITENNQNLKISKAIESINIDQNATQNNVLETISTGKLKIDQHSNLDLKESVEENMDLLENKIKFNVTKVNENISTQDSQTIQHSIKVEFPDDQNEEKYVGNETVVSSRKNSDSNKAYKSASPRSSIITNRVLGQYIAQKIEETRDLSPTEIEKSLNDEYKAILKRGDVVNLKLNIEIENHDGNQTKQNENLNSQSVTIIHTDKGSQSNIDDQIIGQSKSLSSLIMKELNNHHAGDNHRVIIVQYNCCKYCNLYNNPKPDPLPNKNYFILLPIEKFEELTERCRCSKTRPDIQVSSIVNYPKTTYSCVSLVKVSAETAAQNINSASDTKCEVNRKKSVAINEESTTNTRESSKMIQEISLAKMRIGPVSVESFGMVHTVEMINGSTQTEWCDVLLEARILSDGHYSFRLPPLELLKYYKLT